LDTGLLDALIDFLKTVKNCNAKSTEGEIRAETGMTKYLLPVSHASSLAAWATGTEN